MGRRRAENVCASLLLSCRAPRTTPSFRHVRSASKGPRRPSERPLRNGYFYFVNQDKERIGIQCWTGATNPDPPERTKRNCLPHPRVAVLGGGLTGLTTAFYLARKLPPTSKIVVYESGDRWGGWIKSERTKVGEGETEQEVLFERGPRLISLARTNHRLDKLVFIDILETLGLLPVRAPRDLPRYIYDSGRLRTNNLYDILTSPTAWKMAREYASSRFRDQFHKGAKTSKGSGLEDLSTADLVINMAGSRTMVNGPLSALMHGIWGGDVDKLSAISAAGGMYDKYRMQANLDNGQADESTRSMSSMTEKPDMGQPGAAAKALAGADPDSMLYSKKEYLFFQRFFDDLEAEGRVETFMQLWSQASDNMDHVGPHGLESLPLGLADMLESAPNVELRLGTPVKSLGYAKQRNKVQVVDQDSKSELYDKVISTIPADKLEKVAGNNLSLAEFPAVTIMTVNIWYPLDDVAPKGVGYLIPAATPHEENPERALGVFFDTSARIGERQVHTKGSEATAQGNTKQEGGTKLFVLMGGHLYDRDGVKPPTPEEAIEQAKNLLERHLNIPKDTPCHAVASLAENCLPQHNVGHFSRLTTLHNELEEKFGNRLAVAGGSFTKPGVAGAMRAGYDIADTVANEDFMTTGLENTIEPECYAPIPLTFVNGISNNKLFQKVAGVARRTS